MQTRPNGKTPHFVCLVDVVKHLCNISDTEKAQDVITDILIDNLQHLADCMLGVSQFDQCNEIMVDYALLRILLPLMPLSDTPEFRRKAMSVLVWLHRGDYDKGEEDPDTDEYYACMPTTCSQNDFLC